MYMNTLFVGIDISQDSFTTSYIDIDSNIFLSKKNKVFSNSPNGLEALIDILVKLAQNHSFTKIKIGYEATNNYGFHIPFYLSESKKLNPFLLEIFQINPKIIKNARKTYSEIPKDDFHDPYVIAERLKNGNLPPYNRFNPHYFSLRFLTRSRFDIVKKISSIKSRFISILFIKASAYLQHKVFSNKCSNTALNLFTYYDSVETIAKLEITEIIDFIIKHSKNHFKDPEKTAAQIQYIARESYRPNRVMHDNITYSLLTMFKQIKFFEKELKDLEKQIEKSIETFRNQYNILMSIHGFGTVLSAGIIAELGDLSDFTSQKAIAKFAGIIWRIRQSGKYRSEETELTKTGNKYLRYYLVEAAQSVVKNNKDFLPYYHKKFREVAKHNHKRALLFVARKLIRVIYSLLKKNQLYKTPEYIKNQYN